MYLLDNDPMYITNRPAWEQAENDPNATMPHKFLESFNELPIDCTINGFHMFHVWNRLESAGFLVPAPAPVVQYMLYAGEPVAAVKGRYAIYSQFINNALTSKIVDTKVPGGKIPSAKEGPYLKMVNLLALLIDPMPTLPLDSALGTGGLEIDKSGKSGNYKWLPAPTK